MPGLDIFGPSTPWRASPQAGRKLSWFSPEQVADIPWPSRGVKHNAPGSLSETRAPEILKAIHAMGVENPGWADEIRPMGNVWLAEEALRRVQELENRKGSEAARSELPTEQQAKLYSLAYQHLVGQRGQGVVPDQVLDYLVRDERRDTGMGILGLLLR